MAAPLDVIRPDMKARYRAQPSAVGWVTAVSGDEASVFIDGSVKTVPVSDLEPVPDLVEVTSREFRVALTRRRLENPVTDQYLSYKASNTRLFYHQFIPVKKLLESPDQRLLIADEVGTGKTIEAGLIWAELESRSGHGLENVWIVCPKSLVGKWRDEMLQRFDLYLEVLNSEGLRQALAALRRDGSLPPRFSKCVVNLELIRAEDNANRLADSPIAWDLAIFDEAHHLRNPDTLSFAVARLLCERSRAAVFLTATPLQTSLEDLVHLMEALGVDVAEDPHALHEQLRWDMDLNDWIRLIKNRPPGWVPHARRLLSELADGGGRSRSGWNAFRDLVEGPSLNDKARRTAVVDAARHLQVLDPYMTRTARADIEENRPTREAVTKIVRFGSAEKALYDAVYAVCLARASEQGAPPGFVTQMPERRTASCVPAVALEILAQARENEDDDHEASFSPGEVRALRPLAEAARESQDEKLEALGEMLTHAFGELEADRAMVFSTFRGTLRYLARELAGRGFSLEVMHGGTPARDEECKRGEKSRERIATEFRRGAFQILLTSEVAGEGLDFEHCCVVVNYDLPWNPMRVEQRIGRCDRLGQASDKVHIRSLSSEGTIESRILDRLYQRLGIFERALGELEVVLGEAVAEFERDLFARGFSERQQLDRLEQVARSIEARELHRQQAAQSGVISSQGRGLIDSDQQDISDAEAGFLTPEDLAEFVDAAMQRRLPETLLRTAKPGEFKLRYKPELREALSELLKLYPAASSARHQIARFRERLGRLSDTRAPMSLSFAAGDSEAEFVHARHPLLLLARYLDGRPSTETPWCSGAAPSEIAPGPSALVWAIATLEGYTSRSELICARIDLTAASGSDVTTVEAGEAQRLLRAMTEAPPGAAAPGAGIESVRARAQQVLWERFQSARDAFESGDRALADKAKRAVRSHAERQQRRNNDQLAKLDLDPRLRDLYSGWNHRIEQETATKLEDIEQRSGVRSSLEVIGIALLAPNPAPS